MTFSLGNNFAQYWNTASPAYRQQIFNELESISFLLEQQNDFSSIDFNTTKQPNHQTLVSSNMDMEIPSFTNDFSTDFLANHFDDFKSDLTYYAESLKAQLCQQIDDWVNYYLQEFSQQDKDF